MTSLRERMTHYGFESNQHYDYVLQSLQNTQTNQLHCLQVSGPAGRHKTAFANAFARSIAGSISGTTLEHKAADEIVYFDFSVHNQAESIAAPFIKPEDQEHLLNNTVLQKPLQPLDKTLSDACAYSEASRTILILDQLQLADFKDQIRLYDFILTQEWQYPEATFYATRKNLWVILISETELYYSLQKLCFKVWVQANSQRELAFTAKDFQLESDADELLLKLQSLFTVLQIAPTFSELKQVIQDIQQHVRTEAALIQSLFGWVNSFAAHDYQRYLDSNLTETEQAQLSAAVQALEDYIGVTEEVEILAVETPIESH